MSTVHFNTEAKSNNFAVQIVDEPSGLESVRSLAQDFLDHSQKLARECTDEKVRKIFVDNSAMMGKMQQIIGMKLDSNTSEHFEKYKVVVAYDSQQIAQAIGIILPEYEFLPDDANTMIKCSQLLFLATAYWNIDCPQTKDEKYKIKGAGTSIVNFCSSEGKKFGSQGEVFLKASASSIEFYREKLHFKIVGKNELGLIPMLLN